VRALQDFNPPLWGGYGEAGGEVPSFNTQGI
jgi:hypothetical protein